MYLVLVQVQVWMRKGDVGQAINQIEQSYKIKDPDEKGSQPVMYAAFVTQVGGSQAEINVQDGYD